MTCPLSAPSLSLSLSLPPNFQKIFPRRRRSVDGIGMLPAMRQGTTLVSGTQFSEDIARGYKNCSIRFKTAQLRKNCIVVRETHHIRRRTEPLTAAWERRQNPRRAKSRSWCPRGSPSSYSRLTSSWDRCCSGGKNSS